ncbi:MAG: glycosyltransferase [Bacteroidetes bacterium]|nr:glycosyltransferase [Bacteroidota bacterium]MBU1115185.1 glycosyltransferase [Bacteroidota bacterium]MBU1799356.1 glycosyltransferase [Bacteroidota bacterium]
MKIKKIELVNFSLNLGELHNLSDFEHFNPVLKCIDEKGNNLTATMRLHISEPLDKLIFADPRQFEDGGISANSVGSKIIRRKNSYTDKIDENIAKNILSDKDIDFFEVDIEALKKMMLKDYDFDNEVEKFRNSKKLTNKIAFTCHDPNILGGGNIILFRLINWLAELGVEVTVYSCGSPPSWKKVYAEFRCFKTYDEMFAAIEEEIVVLYSMWHIEGMLKTNPIGKKVYHIRQIYEPFHYGQDYASMIGSKPPIQLLESLPIGVITISPHLKDYYKRLNNIDSFLISNGLDPEVFYPTKEKNINKKNVKLVSVGDPNHFVKGTKVLAEALINLAKKRNDIAFEWRIVSGSKRNIDFGELPANLKIIHLSGLNQTKMREEYNNADIAVNPSLYEGFGLPSLEAMLCGTPVIQADNLGLDFILENEKDCLIVPVNDSSSMADSIEKIVDDKDLAKKLSINGYKKAMLHTTYHQFNMFYEVFENILNIKFNADKTNKIKAKLSKNVVDVENSSKDISINKDYSPLISVVIPSYNQAEYLKEALDSLFAQTYNNWEAVIINDGSKDHTKEVMESYAKKDSRIRPFSKENGGITSALNAGLEKSKGEFFCWLSSDDLFYPQKLELQVNAFKDLDDSYALVYGSFDILQHETNTIDVQPFQNPLIPGCEFPEAMKFDFIDGCTIMIRMNVMKEVNGFNPSIIHSQDMELWVRLASYGYKFHIVPQKLTIRRVHKAQSSTSNMIHCRYDAAWMMNFYLDNYNLTEMYRYIDFGSKQGIERFIEHFVGRMLHTEANINHPLLQEKYWNWFVEGIKAFQPSLQNILLRNILIQLINNRTITYKIDFYIEKCIEELKKERKFKNIIYNYSVQNREFSQISRSSDLFSEELFNYGLNLLVNAYTPLFAQELAFHDVNKIVDTPYRLAHSVFRYLSQFDNPHREIVTPFIDLKLIPETELEAINLFCDLAFPQIADFLKLNLQFAINGEMNIDRIAESEDKIKAMPTKDKKRLEAICNLHPTSVILNYWYALALAEENKIEEALNVSWKIYEVNNVFFSWFMAFQISLWAEKVKDYDKAFYAIIIAGELNQSSEIVKSKLISLTEKHGQKNQIIPTPRKFIENELKIDLPRTELKDCEVIPMLNGKFVFSAICLDSLGNEFKVGGNIDYAEKFESIIVTNISTQKKYYLLAKDIFNFFKNSYNFDSATDNYLKNTLIENKNLSIAFSIPNASVISGGSIIAFRFVNWLAKLGVNVAVYSNSLPPSWIELNAEFHTIIKDVERYNSIREPNIVAFSVIELQKLLRFNSGQKRIFHLAQVIEDFHYHGFDFESIMKPKGIFEILHSLPVGRISISQHIDKYLLQNYKQKSFLIENGIDLSIFKPKWKKMISNDELTITTIGSPDRMLKGVSDVVDAVKLLAERHVELKIRLIILSGHKPQINKFISTFHHNINVTLLWGLQPTEVRDIYHQTDIYVNGSWYEGFGLPSLEAMACGVPVVQADNKGLDGIVDNKVNCLLYQPSKVDKLSNAIEELYLNSELREKIIVEGLKTADKYSISNQFQAFVTEFEKILICKFNDNVVKSIKEEIQRGTIKEKIVESSNLLHPVFSIIVTINEHENEITKTLNSLLSQKYGKWEAVIVYSGKNSKVLSTIRSFSTNDTRIKYLQLPPSKYSVMLNAGLKQSNGEWIITMPSGVFYADDRLVNLVNSIEQVPDKKILYSEYYLFQSNSEPKLADPDCIRNIPNKSYQIFGLFNYNYIFTSAMITHHSVFDEIGYFDENFDLAAEYYHLLKVHTKFQSEFIRVGGCAGFLPILSQREKYSLELIKELKNAIEEFLKRYDFNKIFNFVDLEKIDNIKEVTQIINIVISNNKSILGLTSSSKSVIDYANGWIEKKVKDKSIRVSLDRPNTSINTKLIGNNKTIETELSYSSKEIIAEKQKHENSERKAVDRTQNEKVKSQKEQRISIVLLSYNNKKYIEECLNSIRKYTKHNHEIVIIDNASDKETIEFLKVFSSENNVKLVLNKENLGFPGGNNVGINNSIGDYILFINNDTIVTEGWLERMLEIAEAHPEIGIVGPISNSVSGRQLDKNARYESIEDMHKYAAKVKNENKGQFFQFPRVAFLCTLVKKEVIDKIGGLDERYSPGNFEDDDFCLRAQMAGYKTVIATDVFIHHYGSVSFKVNGESEYAKRIEINKQKFVDKWGADPEEIWIKGIKPKQREIKFAINSDLFNQHIERAFINIDENEHQMAIENLAIAIANFKTSDRKGYENLLLDELIVILGNLYIATNNLEKAKETFEAALNENPNSSLACQGLGDVFSLIEEYEASKTMFEWAVQNDEKNELAIQKLININKILGLDENDFSLNEKT